MTGRRIRIAVRVCASVLVMAFVLTVTAPALAGGIGISVGAPDRVVVGQEVEVKAVLSQDGVPVEGAEVALTYQAVWAGESSRVELATAITDEAGVAVMTYQQRADNNREMQVVYLGPGTEPVAPYEFTIVVETGGEQLYVNHSGVEIPFINGTLVILVIATVWFLISLAAVYLVRVGLAGRSLEAPTAEDGSMWISVLLASVAVFTAIGMVIVFVRAPVSNADITDPNRYDRTPIAYLEGQYPYEGFGLNDESDAETGDFIIDGSVLFFKYGCAACHGTRGQGAVVGPVLLDEVGSFGSFSEDVGAGPRGMPGYDEVTISDENMEKIYTYLEEGG